MSSTNPIGSESAYTKQTPDFLAKRQELVEDIFKHKSDINNITLQLERVNPDQANPEWMAKAKYAKRMKEAELERLESVLESVNEAIRLADKMHTAEGDDESRLLAEEFVHAAKRRLQPDTYDSILEEAREVMQDRLYDSVGSTGL